MGTTRVCCVEADCEPGVWHRFFGTEYVDGGAAPTYCQELVRPPFSIGVDVVTCPKCSASETLEPGANRSQ
jgi:hypothetical protein